MGIFLEVSYAFPHLIYKSGGRREIAVCSTTGSREFCHEGTALHYAWNLVPGVLLNQHIPWFPLFSTLVLDRGVVVDAFCNYTPLTNGLPAGGGLLSGSVIAEANMILG